MSGYPSGQPPRSQPPKPQISLPSVPPPNRRSPLPTAQRRRPSRLPLILTLFVIGGFMLGALAALLVSELSFPERAAFDPTSPNSAPLEASLDPTAIAPASGTTSGPVRATTASNRQPLSPTDATLEGPLQVDPANLVNEADPFALHPWAKTSYVPSIMYHDVVEGVKDVWFDHTVEELRRDFEAIKAAGVTPISIDDFYDHLRYGKALPDRPILLTFDDAYLGQYELAYPLLQEYNYPAAYFVQTGFVGVPTSKDHFTWDQMIEMDRSGLIAFAAHTVNHPEDMRLLSDEQLRREVFVSKEVLEERLGHDIHYFAYPTGHRDERVMDMLKEAGYLLSFTMDTGFAGQSPNLLEVQRFNQFRLTEAIIGSRFVPQGEIQAYQLDATAPVTVDQEVIDQVRLTLLRGGRPASVHADKRYEVGTLVDRYHATGGINGSFFAIPWINHVSNIMIGPVLAANHGQFIPGRPEDNPLIQGRPLVLIGEDRIGFVPFHAETMNTLGEIRTLMPDVQDLFVAGLWLVKDGKALDTAAQDSFRLSSASEFRPRVFFGVDKDGQAVGGATQTHVNSVILASILEKAGIQEAVLLDSGFSSSLLFEGEVLATGHSNQGHLSRPVPHALLFYDLHKLAANPLPTDPLERLVAAVPEAEQVITRQVFEQVQRGQRVLQRGDRGPAITALQLALERIAHGEGQPSPLISGPDGTYGNEVVQALKQHFAATRLVPLERLSNAAPSLYPAPPLVATAAAPLAQWSQANRLGAGSEAPIDGSMINQAVLQRLLQDIEQSPPPVLVNPTLPTQVTANL